MAVLTTSQRKKIPTSKFAGPGRTYPVPDVAHAKAAIIDAAVAEKKGHISAAEEKHIDAMAERVIHQSKPGNHKTK